jgi:hypothetical protein
MSKGRAAIQLLRSRLWTTLPSGSGSIMTIRAPVAAQPGRQNAFEAP